MSVKTYGFDVKLFGCVRVEAKSEAEAKALVEGLTKDGHVEFDVLPDGKTYLTADVSRDGEVVLMEVDGEAC